MTFDDRLYRSNHGAKPRGRGLWWFMDAAFLERGDLPVDYLDHAFYFSGTYAEAKRLAVAKARGSRLAAEDFFKMGLARDRRFFWAFPVKRLMVLP